jgi:hypothetical protein
MPLWHFHSDVLDGFYASEVYVSAISKPWAVQQALMAFDKWVQYRLSEYGYIPLIDDGFNDLGQAETQLADLYPLQEA